MPDYDLDACVADLESGKMNGEVQGRLGAFLRDPENLVAFFKLVDAGVEFTFAATNMVRKLSQQEGSWVEASAFWDGAAWFARDDVFTDTRMQLIGASLPWGDVKRDLRLAALRQLRRMCEAGRTDVFRCLGVAPEVESLAYAGEDEFLLAYDAGWAARMVERIEQLEKISERLLFGRFNTAATEVDIAALKAKQAVGEHIKADAFTNIWLRAAISETEWQDARHLPVTLLRDLYPQVWNDGYRGFQLTVLYGSDPA